MAKEAKARIKINKLLEESGWRFLSIPLSHYYNDCDIMTQYIFSADGEIRSQEE